MTLITVRLTVTFPNTVCLIKYMKSWLEEHINLTKQFLEQSQSGTGNLGHNSSAIKSFQEQTGEDVNPGRSQNCKNVMN